MNFLAHLYLARQSEDAMLGSIIGDFVKGDYTGLYNPVIETEIFVHRKIDLTLTAVSGDPAGQAVIPSRRAGALPASSSTCSTTTC